MPTLADLYPAYRIQAPTLGLGSLGQPGTFAGLPMGALAALVQQRGGGVPSPVLASYRAPASGPVLSTGLPASIRTNNPGAMWPGPSAARFGATEWQPVAGGNRIAVFRDPVSGAAAQFDLLDRNYANMRLADAIRRWSGGNASDAYVSALTRTTGIQPHSVLTSDLFRNPDMAIPLARAMAQWEAGRPYPLTDAQWLAAHSMAFPR